MIKIYNVNDKIWTVSSNNSISIDGVKYPLELFQEIVGNYFGGCVIDKCDNEIYKQGVCMQHYKKLNDVNEQEYKILRRCTVQGCDNSHHAKGYCMSHYDSLVKKPKLKINKSNKFR